MKAKLSCKVVVMKISFHSYANKTDFHMKSFDLSLAFIVRFTATRKWPAQGALQPLGAQDQGPVSQEIPPRIWRDFRQNARET